MTPEDKLEGREMVIFAERKRKLVAARQRRAQRRQQADTQRASAHNPDPLKGDVAYA